MLRPNLGIAKFVRTFKKFKRPGEVSALTKFMVKRDTSKKQKKQHRFNQYFFDSAEPSLLVDRHHASSSICLGRKRGEYVRNIIEEFIIDRISTGEISTKCTAIDKIIINSISISQMGKTILVNYSPKGDNIITKDEMVSIENTIRYSLTSENILGNIPPVKLKLDILKDFMDEYDEALERVSEEVKSLERADKKVETELISVPNAYDSLRMEIVRSIKNTNPGAVNNKHEALTQFEVFKKEQQNKSAFCCVQKITKEQTTE